MSRFCLCLFAVLAALTITSSAQAIASSDDRPPATEVLQYGKLGELPLAAVTPNGWTREFLVRQRAGLTGQVSGIMRWN
jgi:hypothetical protein